MYYNSAIYQPILTLNLLPQDRRVLIMVGVVQETTGSTANKGTGVTDPMTRLKPHGIITGINKNY